MRLRRIALTAAVLAGVSSSSFASSISLSDTFSATFAEGSPYTAVTGSFSASFDDSVRTNVEPGIDLVYFALDSLALVPATFGATTFDVSNSGGRALYRDDVLQSIIIGGTTDGFPQLLDPTGDWRIVYGFAGGLPPASGGFVYRIEGNNYVGFDMVGDFQFEAVSVPEPSAVSLLLVGLVGVSCLRRPRGPAW